MSKPAPPMAERPRCPACAKPLKPVIVSHYATKEVQRMAYRRLETSNPGVFRMAPMPTGDVDIVPGDVTAREWNGHYQGYGAFCTLRCCEAYANAMFKRHGTLFTLTPKQPKP